MDNVVHLRKPPRQIAHFLRVGFREHTLGDRMRAEGRLSQTGYVFEAGSLAAQTDLITDLKDEGHQLILDTNVAEQSVVGRFSGSVASAPWAHQDRPLDRDDFNAGTNRSVIEPIARFTRTHGFHSVLSPTHYLGGNQSFWFDIDRETCIALRQSLDQEGCEDVAINYALLLDNAQMKDEATVSKIIDGIRDLPIDALWLRVSGFGADATGVGTDRMARAVLRFHALGLPIIMDRLGGMTAYALASLGVTSGFSNGFKGKDSNKMADWPKPKKGGGGGNAKAVFVAGLDRRVKIEDMQSLFAASTTARTVYGCRNPSCCSSIDVMLREPEAHHLSEQKRIITELSTVPEARRADYFLDTYVEGMRAKAERSQKLKKAPPEFQKVAEGSVMRLNRMKDALETTAERMGSIEFAPEASRTTQTRRNLNANRNET